MDAPADSQRAIDLRLPTSYRWIIGFGFGFVALGFITLVVDWGILNYPNSAGTAGDFWGGHLAAAGSLAATFLFFVALLLQRDALLMQRSAVLMQSKELELQREELRLTREELKASREVSLVQADELKKQTQIAAKSAFMQQITEAVRHQANFSIQRHSPPHDPNLRAEYWNAIERNREASLPYLLQLFNSPLFDQEWERAYLARAAGIQEQVAAQRGVEIRKSSA